MLECTYSLFLVGSDKEKPGHGIPSIEEQSIEMD